MFEILDRRTSLTGNQIKILTAAIIGDALEFFDYFLIGFVLTFIIGPWKLTFGQSAVVLLSLGIGAIIGAYATSRWRPARCTSPPKTTGSISRSCGSLSARPSAELIVCCAASRSARGCAMAT